MNSELVLKSINHSVENNTLLQVDSESSMIFPEEPRDNSFAGKSAMSALNRRVSTDVNRQRLEAVAK